MGGSVNSHTKPTALRFCWLIFFNYTSSFVQKRRFRYSDVQFFSCDWSWHSHGSLIPGKFDLKVNRFMKTPWQEYRAIAFSYSSAPAANVFETTATSDVAPKKHLWRLKTSVHQCVFGLLVHRCHLHIFLFSTALALNCPVPIDRRPHCCFNHHEILAKAVSARFRR